MTALEATMQSQPDYFWRYVFLLIRLRWSLFISNFRHAKPLRRFSYVFLGVLILGAFAGIYLLANYLFGLVRSPQVAASGVDVTSLLEIIPSLSLTAVFLVILLASFGILLQALYLANDMDFLLTAPIPVRAVFLSKLLLAIFPNFILVLTFCLPILFSLGRAQGYNGLYYGLTFAILAFLSVVTAGISSLLVLAVARVFPAKRVAEVLALLSAIFFMVLSQLGNLTGVNSASFNPQRITRGVQIISSLNGNWSPLAWAGHGLIDIGAGRWASGIFLLSLTISLASGGFWLILLAAEHLYYSGWASMQVSSQRKKGRRSRNHSTTWRSNFHLSLWLRQSQVWVILIKDLKNLRRDLRFTTRMIMPFIMGIVFTVMMLRSNATPTTINHATAQDFWKLLLSGVDYGNMAPSLWIGSTLILNLGLIAFSIEGKSYWIIKAAPVNAPRQLEAKFLITYLPSLVLSWLFLLVAAALKDVPANICLYNLLATAFLLAGLNGIILSIGVYGVNVHWDDPRRISVALTDTAGIVSTIVYLIVAVALFFGLPILLSLQGWPEWGGQLAGLLAGGSVALACAILPPASVRQRVYGIGEE